MEEARTFRTQIFNEGDLNFVSVKQLTGTAQGKIYNEFLKINLDDISPFVYTLIPLFWAFVHVSSEFQSQGGFHHNYDGCNNDLHLNL